MTECKLFQIVTYKIFSDRVKSVRGWDDLRIKRQSSECNIYIDVLRPLTNDLWVFLFQTIDAEYVKWTSPARTYVHVKAFIVKVNKCLKLFFLEQHINIVNRVTLQSFWFICSCLSYTQKKDSSNNHLHTLSTKLIIVCF